MPPEAPVISAVNVFDSIVPRQSRRSLLRMFDASPKEKARANAPAPGNSINLSPNQHRLDSVNRIPRSSGLQLAVHIINILHSFSLQPRTESRRTLLRINRNAILPGRAPAQHAVELHSRFAGQFESLAELGIANARRKINEGPGSDVRSLVEQVNGLLLAISFLPAKTLHALDELHLTRHFHLQHVDPVPILAELPHAFSDDLRLFLRVVQSLLVRPLVISYKLQKVRNVICAAFVANPLYPGMLYVIHFLGIERSVVKQNLHTVGASFFQPSRRPVIEQIAQSSRTSLVVSRLFICQQQSGILGTPFRRRQSPLRVQKNGAGMRRQNFRDQRLELLHHCVADFPALFFTQRLLQ